jgi:hypothetical protein
MQTHDSKGLELKATNRDELEHKTGGPNDGNEPDLDAITTELKAITDRLADLEAKAKADPEKPETAESTALGDRIAELENTITELKAAATVADADADTEDGQVTELKTMISRLTKRIDGYEAKTQAPTDARAGEPVMYAKAVFDGAKESGQLDQWQQGQVGIMAGRGKGIAVPSLFQPLNDVKAPTPIGLTQVGDLAPTYRDPELVRLREAPASMMAVVPYLGVDGATTYEYYRETGASQYGYLHTTCTSDPGGGTTPTNQIEVDDASGFLVGQQFRVHLAASTEIETIVSVDEVNNILTVGAAEIDFDVPVGTSVTSTVYGATAESQQKPAGIVAYSKQELTLKTLAITAPMTQQALNSVAGLQAFVQEEMQFRQQLVIDWHILYGDGTDAKELDGFLTNTNAQTYLWSTGTSKDTMADAVMRARLLIRPKGALVCTMNEADWLDILTAKATDEHYLMTAFGPMRITNEPTRRAIGDITVNIVDAMQQGDFLLANHARASKFVDQQRSSFATGYVNAQFIENEITARHEDTVAHAIGNFQAYVYGSWDSQPA